MIILLPILILMKDDSQDNPIVIICMIRTVNHIMFPRMK